MKQIPCGDGLTLPSCSLAEVFLAALRGVCVGGMVFAGRVVLIAKFAVKPRSSKPCGTSETIGKAPAKRC
jgi:hypothetical protein